MALSFAENNPNKAPEELSWFYIQPGFKLITPGKLFLAILLFALILGFLALLDPQKVLDSSWTLIIVPLDAIFVGWLLMALQPHRQIFYRIDENGVFSEYRSSASPLASLVDLILGLISSAVGLKHMIYINKHSSRSRTLEWGEIVSTRQYPNGKKIVLQAGLHGQMTLWTNTDNYGYVLTLVRKYVSQARKNYD